MKRLFDSILFLFFFPIFDLSSWPDRHVWFYFMASEPGPTSEVIAGAPHPLLRLSSLCLLLRTCCSLGSSAGFHQTVRLSLKALFVCFSPRGSMGTFSREKLSAIHRKGSVEITGCIENLLSLALHPFNMIFTMPECKFKEIEPCESPIWSEIVFSQSVSLGFLVAS